MKRIITLFFAAMLAGQAWAQTSFEIDGLKYTVTDETNHYVSVGQTETKPTGNLVIPSEVENEGVKYAVTTIGNKAFYYCYGLTSVNIPNSVMSIGQNAFESCHGLTAVTIPNSVTSIGNTAFYKCSSLASVTIPNSVTSIGDYVFSHCSGLTSVTIPESVTSIDYGVFENCSGLTSVTIPNSVTIIGNYAFDSCRGLTSVTIPNSVTSIGRQAFRNCTALTTHTIPNTVTSIGEDAFSLVKNIVFSGSAEGSPWGALNVNAIPDEDGFIYSDATKTKLTAYIGDEKEVTIPNSVTEIGRGAFAGCSGLTSVTIPESVASIGEYAFYCCIGLTSLTIPNSVTTIGISAFYNVKNIVYSGSASGDIFQNSWGSLAWNGTVDGDFIYANEKRTTLSAYIGNSGNVVIPENVKNIGERAFAGCNLAMVTIPNSVTSIGEYAFDGCSSLTSITIPNSVTSIGEYAFHGCSSLTSITIPNSVTSIGYRLFSDCTSLTSVTISDKVRAIPMWTFYECNNLTNVTIGNAVTYIGEYAFYKCTSLTSIIIPDKVRSIEDGAFSGCSNLTTVTIPDDITNINLGNNVFNNCNNLQYNEYDNALYLGNPGNPYVLLIKKKSSSVTSCDINTNCKVIGTKAFEFCNIKSIIIPNEVRSIGDGVFSNCKSITSVSIPITVNNVGKQAFSGCNNLKTVSFNTNAVGNVFAGNTSIEKLIVGESVTKIAEKAFYGCSNLDTIIIPKTVESIGKDAFVCEGTCGDNARWKYDMLTKTMTISGTGFLKHYGYDFNTQTDIKTPWADFADKIESVVVEEGINGLGACAFNNCANIKRVSLSSTCTDYGGSAFDNCPKLQKVAVRGKYVMRVNDHCFSNYENCTLYVPMDKVDYYKNEIVFKDFSKIIGAYMVTIDSNIVNGSVMVDSTAIVPGGSFTITATPYEGYRIGSVTVNDSVIEKNDTAYLVENVNENLTVSVSFLLIKSGTCGENLTWEYDSENQTLTICGTGDMYDYQEGETPWNVLKDKTKISNIVIEKGVTGIGNNAFNNVKASTIDLAETVNKLGCNCITYYAKVFIHGTEIKNIDGAFSTSFEQSGTIIVPIENMEQIADSKVFEGLKVKYFCTIIIAGSIEGGSISAAESCTAGNTITITVEPNTGFEIESVTANAKPIEPSNKRYSLVVDSNIVLSATFKAIDYQISTDSYYGIIKVSKTAHYGDTVSFTVEPDKGYKVLYTSVSDGNYRDVDMINDSMFVMPAKDVTIYAYFEEDDHTPVTESAANAINIYAYGNQIVVENATDEIRVYDAMGRLVGRDVACRVRATITVKNTGVYIVKTGDVVKRVVVN